MTFFDNSDIGLTPDSPCVCGKKKTFIKCCGKPRDNVRPPHEVAVHRGRLSNRFCDQLVAYAEKKQLYPLSTRTVANPGYASIDDSFRKSFAVELGAGARAKLNQLAAKAFYDWARTHSARPLAKCEPIDLMCYEEGGFFKGHADSELFDPISKTWKRTLNRDISLLIYLNDDYDGGTLVFNRFNYRFNPKKGDLLVFPSHNLYLHEVESVRAGRRYVVVSWAYY